jgi:hypothetical protein
VLEVVEVTDGTCESIQHIGFETVAVGLISLNMDDPFLELTDDFRTLVLMLRFSFGFF